MKLELSQEEKTMIITALNMRKCYIETGDVVVSANDVANGFPAKVNPLSVDQMKLLIKTDELITKLFNLGV